MYDFFHLLFGSKVNSAFDASEFNQMSTGKSWGYNGKK